MNAKVKKWLIVVAKVGMSGASLWFVLSRADLHSLSHLLKETKGFWLGLSALFFVLSKFLSAFRLNRFFRDVQIIIPQRVNLRLYMLGMFYNLFLPGGIGGDGYKVYYLKKRYGASVKQGLLAVLIDRVTGLISLVVLALGFALLLPGMPLPRMGIAMIAAGTASAFYLVVHKWFRVFYTSLHYTNLLSFGVQAAQVISATLILVAMGVEQSYIEYLFVFLLSSVVAVVPFTIGGIGAREVTFLVASGMLRLDLSHAIALSLLFFAITGVVSMTGIVYVFRGETIHQ